MFGIGCCRTFNVDGSSHGGMKEEKPWAVRDGVKRVVGYFDGKYDAVREPNTIEEESNGSML